MIPEIDFAKCRMCKTPTVVIVDNGLCDKCFIITEMHPQKKEASK